MNLPDFLCLVRRFRATQREWELFGCGNRTLMIAYQNLGRQVDAELERLMSPPSFGEPMQGTEDADSPVCPKGGA